MTINEGISAIAKELELDQAQVTELADYLKRVSPSDMDFDKPVPLRRGEDRAKKDVMMLRHIRNMAETLRSAPKTPGREAAKDAAAEAVNEAYRMIESARANRRN
jgi:hypothetical protein